MKSLQIGSATFILLTFLASCSTPQPTITDTPITPSTATPSNGTATHKNTTPTKDTSLGEKTPLPVTPTPTVCTGWRRGVSGTVYEGEARPGNELQGVPVQLTQISSCSPTVGEYQTVTDPDGTFRFDDLYIHDMDAIDIRIEYEGYDIFEQKWGGLEIYKDGFSVDIILEPESQ